LIRELSVVASDAETRLDRFVVAHCPELSRARVQELIEARLVLVDGCSAKASHKLGGGERITVDAQPRPPLRAEPEKIPLDILYEDEDVMVINKPAGMAVHSGSGISSGTLVNALLGRGQPLSQAGDALRPGIVHRLDKGTSGVILVAKNDFAHARLAEAFRKREVKKTYLALVQGKLTVAHGHIDLAIARDPHRRVRMTARRPAILGKAREARTDWRALAAIDNTTLVEVHIHTGRTHQIRAHFAATHHPVVGDVLYGAAPQLQIGKIKLPRLARQFLHAARLAFAHPRSGQWIEVQAPLASDLREFLNELAAASGEQPSRIDAVLAPFL
jgi:23S rRNA pseudouridine1911/1915/1917 synthase